MIIVRKITLKNGEFFFCKEGTLLNVDRFKQIASVEDVEKEVEELCAIKETGASRRFFSQGK